MLMKAEELVAQVDRLATLPAVYQQIKAVLDDPDSAVADMVRVVSSDPAVTARLLRVVNSAYFNAPGNIDSVARAISMLGMNQTHDIALATSVDTLFKGIRPVSMDMRRYWSNSVLRGLIARASASQAGVREVEGFFLEGLLADIGHLVLYQLHPDKAEQALLRSRHEMRPLCDLEREVIGCHYADVGAALAARWHLPARYGQAIAFHIDPAQAPEPYLLQAAILHLARAMCAGLEQGADLDTIMTAVQAVVWEKTPLRPEMAGDIRKEALSSHAEVMGLFFPAA